MNATTCNDLQQTCNNCNDNTRLIIPAHLSLTIPPTPQEMAEC
jgi:hypothetical protein